MFFNDFEMALNALGKLPNGIKGDPMASSPPKGWPSGPKGAPGIAQDECKVPKSTATTARGIQKIQGRGESKAVNPPLYFRAH